MKTILIIILAFILLSCEGRNMAHIGEEVGSELVDTNVTDDTQEYNLTRITSSSHLGFHSFIIKDNVLYATGKNDYGQLGLGDTANRNSYTSTGIEDVSYVSVGESHTVITKIDGTVWSVGLNNRGQLGLGHNTNKNTFVNTGVVAKIVTCGSLSSFVIKNDGSLWSTGHNLSGQLGLGDNNNRNSFVDTDIGEVKIIACGGGFSFIIKNDESLW